MQSLSKEDLVEFIRKATHHHQQIEPTYIHHTANGAYLGGLDLDEFSEWMGANVRKKSVLNSSAIGENLHALLEEANHPLTNTALEYIQELERTLEIERKEARKEEDRLKKQITQLKIENNQFQNNTKFWNRR